MDIRIEPYTPQHVAAVKSFNARLHQQKSAFRLSESAPHGAPRAQPLHREEYLALDDGQVRGGFVIKKQLFWINGQAMEIGELEMSGISHTRIDRMIEKLQAVTPQQVQAVARKYFSDDQLTVATLLPLPITEKKGPPPVFRD